MNKISFLIIVVSLLSCSKDEDSMDVKHLENQLLVYVEGASGDQSMVYPDIPAGNIFTAYVNGIMLNSDGTYDLYFGGYQKVPDYQKLNFKVDPEWTDLSSEIILMRGADLPEVAWRIKYASSHEIIISESFEGRILEYRLESYRP